MMITDEEAEKLEKAGLCDEWKVRRYCGSWMLFNAWTKHFSTDPADWFKDREDAEAKARKRNDPRNYIIPQRVARSDEVPF